MCQTEPFTPWLNAAERERDELKKGFGMKMIKLKAPKRLCDDCIEFDSYIELNTTHGIYKLDGEVPKTLMSGKMSNIS